MTEFAHAMEEALNDVLDVNVGDLVQGEVLTLQDNKQVIVGIVGAGVEGVVPLKELSAVPVENLADVVKVGDVIDLVVISTIKDKENGSYLLSKRRVDERKVWSELEEKFKNGEVIEGLVTNVVKGGLTVDAGVRGFVPASLASDRFVRDLSQFKEQTLTFQIEECDPVARKLILSRKAIVEAEKNEQLAKALEKIAVDSVVEGVVSRLTNFGAFIDLGGVDGLVHVSEISHTHIKNPADVLKAGETIEVKVLAIDTDTNRVSLSIKALQPTPWEQAATTLSEGQAVKGIVKRLADFGAFVEILPGVEGLVHVSQIAHEHVSVPSDVLKPGEEVMVQIRELKPNEQRVSLSIKALLDVPAEEEAE